jgi:hypothetical protein
LFTSPAAYSQPSSIGLPSPVSGDETEVIQAEVLGVRCASGGDEDFVGRDELTVGQGEVHGAGVVPSGLGGVDVQVKGDTARPESSGHMVAGEGLHTGEQPGLGDECHLRAESAERGGHFGSDDTATDDRQPVGDGPGGRGFSARPWCHVRQPPDGRHLGAAAGGDHDCMTGLQDRGRAVGVSDCDGPGAGDASVPTDQGDPCVLEPLDLAGVAPVRRESVTPA